MPKNSSCAALALSCALLASCQTISKAPKGAPRMELELAVTADPSFTAPLADVDDELARAVTERILSMSDIGLRFYPVLARDYGADDPRPDYVMNVQLQDLALDLDHRTVEVEGSDPRIETFVRNVTCEASASLVKRRASGPPLTVGAATGTGTRQVQRNQAGAEGASYALQRAEEEQPLRVERSDIVLAAERAVERAYHELLEPMDRELMIVSGGTPGKK